uniref:Uncharacterized protein n=1 Tax=Rhizophora mucronata TaxID=61149 RepID=A0A2P2INL4_RHIMU
MVCIYRKVSQFICCISGATNFEFEIHLYLSCFSY